MRFYFHVLALVAIAHTWDGDLDEQDIDGGTSTVSDMRPKARPAGSAQLQAPTGSTGQHSGPLEPRSLDNWTLSPFLLVSTLDGTLTSCDRNTGETLWKIEADPLVDIYMPELTSNSTQWLADPSGDGRLLYQTVGGGIERVPASVKDLVEHAPFGLVDNVVYTGARTTTLYAINATSGELLHAYGAPSDGASPWKGAPSADVLLVGRMEYTLDIFETSPSESNNEEGSHWRLKLSHWGPNVRDSDLQHQYTGSLDALYVTPLTNTTIIAMADNDLQPQRWMGRTSSLAVRVMDVLTPMDRPGSQYGLVVQPPLQLKGMSSRASDLYVDRAPSGSGYVAVSGAEFGVLIASNVDAPFCGAGNSSEITGVHPVWCQGATAQSQTNRADPALPPQTTASGSLPLLDPVPVSPVDSTESPYIPTLPPPPPSWKQFVIRIIENFVAGVLMLVFAYGAAVQGWLPGLADALAILAARLNRSAVKKEETPSMQESDAAASSSSTDEPRRPRKRGQRGGKKARELKEKQLGGLSISDEVLGYGSHGTTVLRGTFEARDVAVKRMLLSFYDVASQEVAILSESDDHPNVVRYFCKHETGQFLYIALELCPGTLEDLVKRAPTLSPLTESLYSDPRDALRQITLGLQHLHSLNLVHRDIKPQNILASTKNDSLRLLISDFGLTRRLEADQSSFQPTALTSGGAAGTSGWAAPEMAKSGQRLTRKIDIFSLGCLYFYVLCGGKHPFGENNLRQANIEAAKFDISALNAFGDEVSDLVSKMIATDPRMRPDTSAILRHPFWWSDRRKLDFLVKVSDRLEHVSREETSPLLSRLEVSAVDVVGADWHVRFPQAFVENLGKYRRYHGDRILDLLRALRNKLHHYNDFSPEMQALVGKVPTGYLEFYTSRFPLLFMTVYRFALAEFSGEHAFSDFFG